MAEGRSNQAIAERLFVTLRAVEKHVTSIFVKLAPPGDARGPPPRARRARLPALGRTGRCRLAALEEAWTPHCELGSPDGE